MLTLGMSLQTENSPDAALDMLTDPEAEGALQVSIMERREKRHERRKRTRDASSFATNGQTNPASADEPAAGGAAAAPSHEAAAEAGTHAPSAEHLQPEEVSHVMSNGAEHHEVLFYMCACSASIQIARQHVLAKRSPASC